MTTVPLTECARMLGIDAKTLRQWLKHAKLSVHTHPIDARIKCVTMEQVQQLAALHRRSIQLGMVCTPAPPDASLVSPETPAHLQAVSTTTQEKMVSSEADLIGRLCSLEAMVTTLQQQLTHLTLQLLQERQERYERSLLALETIIKQTTERPALPQLLQESQPHSPEPSSQSSSRRPHQAELSRRSRLIPLIEYGAHGSYVLICPEEGELPFIADSPEWFDWLASLSSFRFVGKLGRFSARRGGSYPYSQRFWSAYRSIHQHRYRHYLGVTERLTIDRLEQAAAALQSHMPSL